jgi:hypothetical protein
MADKKKSKLKRLHKDPMLTHRDEDIEFAGEEWFDLPGSEIARPVDTLGLEELEEEGLEDASLAAPIEAFEEWDRQTSEAKYPGHAKGMGMPPKSLRGIKKTRKKEELEDDETSIEDTSISDWDDAYDLSVDPLEESLVKTVRTKKAARRDN